LKLMLIFASEPDMRLPELRLKAVKGRRLTALATQTVPAVAVGHPAYHSLSVLSFYHASQTHENSS
ncbi:MAG: hypothetical protein K2O27_03550, partial [Candidatus Amulumruptor sp.]|nr:hypothetical protein [Candidatus Amulumruptor sp.]